MRARTGLWEPWVGNDPGPPSPQQVEHIRLRAAVKVTDVLSRPCQRTGYRAPNRLADIGREGPGCAVSRPLPEPLELVRQFRVPFSLVRQLCNEQRKRLSVSRDSQWA